MKLAEALENRVKLARQFNRWGNELVGNGIKNKSVEDNPRDVTDKKDCNNNTDEDGSHNWSSHYLFYCAASEHRHLIQNNSQLPETSVSGVKMSSDTGGREPGRGPGGCGDLGHSFWEVVFRQT